MRACPQASPVIRETRPLVPGSEHAHLSVCEVRELRLLPPRRVTESLKVCRCNTTLATVFEGPKAIDAIEVSVSFTRREMHPRWNFQVPGLVTPGRGGVDINALTSAACVLCEQASRQSAASSKLEVRHRIRCHDDMDFSTSRRMPRTRRSA